MDLDLIDKKLLENLYCIDGLSTNEIARALNISGSTVIRLMIKFGIPRRTISQSKRKENIYEIDGEVTYLVLKNKNGNIFKSLIDTKDINKAKSFPGCWNLYWNKCTRSYYVIGTMTCEDGKRKGFKLHRWLLDTEDDLIVDHINHDTLDNRRKNLRQVDHSGNMQNRKNANSNTTSGVRGVSWHKVRQKWQVNVRVDGKQKYFGIYDNLEEAEKVAKEMRIKYMPYSTD